MKRELVFVNRRKGRERRFERDPCSDMDIDIYHRKRRIKQDRRAPDNSLADDYYAYLKSFSAEPLNRDDKENA